MIPLNQNIISITLETAHLNVLLNVPLRKKDRANLVWCIKYFWIYIVESFPWKKCHICGQNTYVPESCFATGAESKKRKRLLWQLQMANVLYLIKKSFLITQQVKKTKERRRVIRIDLDAFYLIRFHYTVMQEVYCHFQRLRAEPPWLARGPGNK